MSEHKKVKELMGEEMIWCQKINSICPNPEKTCQECKDDGKVWLYPLNEES